MPGEINAGAYVLERSVLDLIPPGREVSIEREVFPRLVGDGLGALRLDGYWMDIGTPERYLQASWDILEGRVETRVRADRAGPVRRRRGRRSTTARRSGRARSSRAGCRVAAGAEVSDSVLLDGCSVGEGADVSAARSSPPAPRSTPGASSSDAVVGRDERVPARDDRDDRRRPRHPRPASRRPLADRIRAPASRPTQPG